MPTEREDDTKYNGGEREKSLACQASPSSLWTAEGGRICWQTDSMHTRQCGEEENQLASRTCGESYSADKLPIVREGVASCFLLFKHADACTTSGGEGRLTQHAAHHLCCPPNIENSSWPQLDSIWNPQPLFRIKGKEHSEVIIINADVERRMEVHPSPTQFENFFKKTANSGRKCTYLPK